MSKIFIRKILRTALCLSLALAMCVPLTACGGTDTPSDTLTDFNVNAKICHTALSSVLTNDGVNKETLSGSVIEGRNTTAEYSGKAVDISSYTGDDFAGYYYAEYNPDTYSLKFVVYSSAPIPNKYKCQLSSNDQENILYTEGFIIGCYPLNY